MARKRAIVDRPLDAVFAAATSVQAILDVDRRAHRLLPPRHAAVRRRGEARRLDDLVEDVDRRQRNRLLGEAIDDLDGPAARGGADRDVEIEAVSRSELEALGIERLARVEAVDGDHARVERGEVWREDPAVGGVDQAKPQPLAGAHREYLLLLAVHGREVSPPPVVS